MLATGFLLTYLICANTVWADTNHTQEFRVLNRYGRAASFISGRFQTPINLDNCKRQRFGKLQFTGHSDFRPEGFLITNNGKTATLTFLGAAPTLTGGPLNGVYTLDNAHFHWGAGDLGSEHSEYGKFFAAELHLVHFKTEYGSVEAALTHADGLAVVGLMFKVSDVDNADLGPILTGYANVLANGATALVPSAAMAWFSKFSEPFHYYTYKGSLTTPFFDEVVNWIVFKHKSTISRNQLSQLRKLLDVNNKEIVEFRRGIQEIGGRVLTCAVRCFAPGK